MKLRTKLLSVVGLSTLLALLVSGPVFSQKPPLPGIDVLKQDAGGHLEVTWNPQTGTPSFIRGHIPVAGIGLASAGQSATIALGAADRYATLLGVVQSAQELRVVQQETDALGAAHVTLAQYHQGIEVYNGFVRVHISPDGQEITSISSSFVPAIQLSSTEPSISADQAVVLAHQHLVNGTRVAAPRLVVYPGPGNAPGSSAKLAWIVELRDDAIPARILYVVDALEGKLVAGLNRLNDTSVLLPPAGLPIGAPAAGLLVESEVGDLAAVNPTASLAAELGAPVSPSLLSLPFARGATWYVCQGYNGAYSHTNSNSLDLTIRSEDVGPNGCYPTDGNFSASAGRIVLAPASGVVTHVITDLLCISFNNGGSMLLGHLDGRIPEGNVNQNQVLGTVSQANGANHGYAHIHVQAHPGTSCASSGASVPFDTAHGMRFAGAPDLPASGAVNEYRGLALTGVASQRYTFDANHSLALPGTLDRTEGQNPTGDADVDQAHDFAGSTYGYFIVTHGRDSYDSLGGAITSTVHYGTNYLNAFWNGDQMVYGDGFAVNDVVAHELTHAVIEHSPALEYQWQSGALNESFADIFAAMVDRDDWLIGEDLPTGALAGRDAIRDMSNPTRFDQPDNTSGWRTVCSDNEGVHSNSGITNKAFYNVATSIGKEKAEQIFYRALTVHLLPTASLEDLRAAALEATHELSQSLGYSNTYQTTYSLVQSGFDSVGLDGYWQPPTNDCVCGASVALIDAPDGLTLLGNLRAVRDALSTQEPGRRWTDLYYVHQFEVASLLIRDSKLRLTAQEGLRAFDPVVRALLDEKAPTVTLTPALIRTAEETLLGLAREGSAALRGDIFREWEGTNPHRFAGWDVRRVKQQLIAEAAGHAIYLPMVIRYGDGR